MMAPEIPKTKQERPKVKQHDETPSGITSHPFVPRGEWWSLCKECGMAQAAHAETTMDNPIRVYHVSEDMVDDD